MTKTVFYVRCAPLNSDVESLTLPLVNIIVQSLSFMVQNKHQELVKNGYISTFCNFLVMFMIDQKLDLKMTYHSEALCLDTSSPLWRQQL